MVAVTADWGTLLNSLSFQVILPPCVEYHGDTHYRSTDGTVVSRHHLATECLVWKVVPVSGEYGRVAVSLQYRPLAIPHFRMTLGKSAHGASTVDSANSCFNASRLHKNASPGPTISVEWSCSVHAEPPALLQQPTTVGALPQVTGGPPPCTACVEANAWPLLAR